MEGSVTDSASNAAHALVAAANTFVDEAQAVSNAGVDAAQTAASGAVEAAISAIEAALVGVKHLIARA